MRSASRISGRGRSIRTVFAWRRLWSALSFGALSVSVACAAADATPASCETAPLAGANVAGAEFNANRVPGAVYRDYVYPGPAEIALLQRLHLRLMRVPFLWERMQPTAVGELDAAELKRLDDVIHAARVAGIRTVIDVHNYGGYRGVSLATAPGGTLPDLWRRLATHYLDQPDVVFGMMNEPNAIGVAQWSVIAGETLLAIRSTGARNVVAIPGSNWDGAHSWLTLNGGISNGDALLSLAKGDPAVVFEVHQYFDNDYSGTKPTCTRASDAVAAVDRVGAWARSHGVRVYLGEFGVSGQPECVAALSRALDVVQRNASAWFGWTYWSAGAWWGDYPFNLQSHGGMTPQGDVLRASADTTHAACSDRSTP